ncbi:hypothetical protein QO206_13400 [Leeuwenhoekiella aequorea]|uniref:hypothetical protein n=1 Tax=Leeuwenhoekiella aequorea TaxID=283736 RepID=UPI00352CCB72|tara:strand:- start:2275 stop:2463 length:189 start_codon:yes stop_codon:yes gene_type:complete
MSRIIELATEKGTIKQGQFVNYKGDEEVSVYEITNKESFNAFYPSEDGCLINIKINDNELKL